jgi:hypothetical protein
VEFVGLLILLGLIAWATSAAFKAGKRQGSRKAYGVGFDRGRRARAKSQTGCLFILLLIFTAAAAFAANFRP